MQVEVRLLGGFRVLWDGRVAIDARWRPAKAAAIIKILALQRDRSLHRDRLIEILWPGADSASGSNNLYKNLHQLREALSIVGAPRDIVRIERGAVSLCSCPHTTVDVDTFRQLAASAKQEPSEEHLARALAAYRGDLLPDDPYDDWPLAQRQALGTLALDLNLQLGQVFLESNRATKAVESFQSALDIDVSSERAHRQLMRAYAADGSRDLALRQYDRCVRILDEELEARPSPETDQLASEIRAGAFAEHPKQDATSIPLPELRYTATLDRVGIAYFQIGRGPTFIQLPMGSVSNCVGEFALERGRAWYERLATKFTLVRYDGRGFGSSDRDTSRLTAESELVDLGAVCEAVGTKAAPAILFATLLQGRTAIRFTAQHPERVAGLVLWSAGPADGRPFGRDLHRAYDHLKYTDWRRFTRVWAHDLWGWDDSAYARRWARMVREGASAQSMDALVAAYEGLDVSSDLANVDVPTLVVGHTRLEGSVAAAEQMAADIPQASLVVLDTRYAPWGETRIVDEAIGVITDFCGRLGASNPRPHAARPSLDGTAEAGA